MTNLRSRYRTVVGLVAAAGAFCAVATISAATAPSAYADPYTDIINAVDGDFTIGQADFTTAFSDFGSNALVPGLAALFEGADTDFLGAPEDVVAGSVEALTNEGITGSITFGLGDPMSFSDAVALAESDFSAGAADFAFAATEFSGGDYGIATLSDLFGADSTFVLPLEELFLGVAASF